MPPRRAPNFQQLQLQAQNATANYYGSISYALITMQAQLQANTQAMTNLQNQLQANNRAMQNQLQANNRAMQNQLQAINNSIQNLTNQVHNLNPQNFPPIGNIQNDVQKHEMILNSISNSFNPRNDQGI